MSSSTMMSWTATPWTAMTSGMRACRTPCLVLLLALPGGPASWAQTPAPPQAVPQGQAAPDEAAPDEAAPDETAARTSTSRFERWLYNPQERTERALEAHNEGHVGGANQALESAMRLTDGDAVSRYNAGTSHLQSSQPDALPLLQGAAADADLDLLPDAQYNLGNAYLGQQDYQNAIEAYKSALRQQPGMESAKFNLELARKLLKEQQQNQDQQDQDPQNQDQQQDQEQQDQEQSQDQKDQPQDQEQNDQEQSEDQKEQQQDQEQKDQQQDQEQQDQQQQEQQNQDPQNQDQEEQQQDQQQQDQQESPLPQFRDLPDMSAEEAAAMLEAIENLEREQRRQDALEAARAQSGRKKDW